MAERSVVLPPNGQFSRRPRRQQRVPPRCRRVNGFLAREELPELREPGVRASKRRSSANAAQFSCADSSLSIGGV